MFKKNVINTTLPVKLTTVLEPNSVIAEQIKKIRTNINFASLSSRLKSIMITSATLGEGKSTISANLAIEYANEGLNVLLIDADMRRPTIHKTFGLSNESGLSTLLGIKVAEFDDSVNNVTANLSVMTSGPKPPNPAELLGSMPTTKLMKRIGEYFDLIIIDAPPILPVTDAQLLSHQVDGTVLVVRQNVAQKAAVVEAIKALEQSHANVFGIVLNDVDKTDRHSGYGYNNGYYDENR